jgi:aspartate 1-decarboxylase
VEARSHRPKVVFVDADNKIRNLGDDPAEAPEGTGLVRGDAFAGR